MSDNQNNTRDLKGWLQRSFSLTTDDLNSVTKAFMAITKSHGFTIRKQNEHKDDGMYIEAIYGSKIIAFLVNLIPFLGRHLPWGKRLGMKASASVRKGDLIDINLSISPYMELFNTSEVLVLSQSADEKATDEYLAAYKIHSITKELFSALNLPIPDEFTEFSTKAFATDIFLSLLIYPLDGYNSAKKVHIPAHKGPKWCWPAFIIPELWFIWHEIWGVSILAMLIEFYGIGKIASYGLPIPVLAGIFLLIRFVFGRLGSKIYFYKYGRWPGNKEQMQQKG